MDTQCLRKFATPSQLAALCGLCTGGLSKTAAPGRWRSYHPGDIAAATRGASEAPLSRAVHGVSSGGGRPAPRRITANTPTDVEVGLRRSAEGVPPRSVTRIRLDSDLGHGRVLRPATLEVLPGRVARFPDPMPPRDVLVGDTGVSAGGMAPAATVVRTSYDPGSVGHGLGYRDKMVDLERSSGDGTLLKADLPYLLFRLGVTGGLGGLMYALHKDNGRWFGR